MKGSRLQGCQADEFVRKNKQNIGEITESQQKQLFEIVYREYVSHARYFYDKVKNNAKIINIVTWEKLHPVLKEVLVDMEYQGVLYSSAIPVFGTNNKDNVIRYINSKPFLFNHDKNRGRVKHIKDNMK
ncbi:hypothetical protein [Rouxiella sp. Mn2063]|uniref:hypothetical protein n=1 Tax=Rouxiella sp. Mn2063 TaxID=3395262 RepID=UPI003BC66515